jgi:predicted transcriptional regulator
MHHILQQKKFQQSAGNQFPQGSYGALTPAGTPAYGAVQTPSSPNRNSSILTALLAKKPKGRPPTPDYTLDRILAPAPIQESNEDEFGDEPKEDKPAPPEDHTNYELKNNRSFQAAMVLIQRLVRGRAVQNIMFEGKYRRRELIAELQMADEEDAAFVEPTEAARVENLREMQKHNLKETTIDALAGSVASNVMSVLAQEQVKLYIYIYIYIICGAFYTLFSYLFLTYLFVCVCVCVIRFAYKCLQGWSS